MQRKVLSRQHGLSGVFFMQKAEGGRQKAQSAPATSHQPFAIGKAERQ